jgi:hypothetical protein
MTVERCIHQWRSPFAIGSVDGRPIRNGPLDRLQIAHESSFEKSLLGSGELEGRLGCNGQRDSKQKGREGQVFCHR